MTALALKVLRLFFPSSHCCPSVTWAQVPAQVLWGAQPSSQPGWGPASREGRGCCGWSRNGNGRVAGSRPRALTRGRSLPHSQRKQARELLAALQKVVVPIYCTSFLAVEEDKQQKIARVHGAAGRGRGRGTRGAMGTLVSLLTQPLPPPAHPAPAALGEERLF